MRWTCSSVLRAERRNQQYQSTEGKRYKSKENPEEANTHTHADLIWSPSLSGGGHFLSMLLLLSVHATVSILTSILKQPVPSLNPLSTQLSSSRIITTLYALCLNLLNPSTLNFLLSYFSFLPWQKVYILVPPIILVFLCHSSFSGVPRGSVVT